MHAVRKIIVSSHKHSFTPYPSLSPYWWTDRKTDRETNTLAAHGLEELFSSCAVVSVFLLWREIVLGVTYLPYQLRCCVIFLLRQEIVVGCTDQFWVVSFRCYLLLIYHTSCAVVSVFWLRWEIVFGCTVSKKDYYLVSLIERESASKCCVYFKRSNILLCISLYLSLVLYRSTDSQTRSFLKISRAFWSSRN